MTILTFLLATFLLLWSLFFSKAHLRWLFAYTRIILRNPLNLKPWFGFLSGPGVILVSFYVSIRTFGDPSAFWLRATIVLILISVATTMTTLYISYRKTKPAYEQYRREVESFGDALPRDATTGIAWLLAETMQAYSFRNYVRATFYPKPAIEPAMRVVSKKLRAMGRDRVE